MADNQLEEMEGLLVKEEKPKEEKKGYISSLVGGIVSASTYVGGGVVNIGKGIFHTATGIVGVGPGINSGVSKISNGVSSVMDGVITGPLESITGTNGPDRFDGSKDFLRKFSSTELRDMAKDEKNNFLGVVAEDFNNERGEDAIRLLRIIAPEIKNWPKKEQAILLNSILSSASSVAQEKEAVEILFEAGIDPNIGRKMTNYFTEPKEISPFYRLFTSSYDGKDEIIKLFLDHGADPNQLITDGSGNNVPLHTLIHMPEYKELVKDYIKPEPSMTDEMPDASRTLGVNSTPLMTDGQSEQRQNLTSQQKTGGRE